MPLTSLGSKTIALQDNWLSFNPVSLKSKTRYLLEVTMSAVSPSLVYSTFSIRVQYPSINSPVIASPIVSDIQFDVIRRGYMFDLNQLYVATGNAIVQVKRRSFYVDPPKIATVTIGLFVDVEGIKY
jgi:hypothetical protein